MWDIMQIISIYTSVLNVCISAKQFFQFVYNSTTKYQLHEAAWAGAGRNCTQDDRSQDKGAACTRQSPPILSIFPFHQNSSSERMVVDCFITPTMNLSRRHFPML